MRTTYRPTMPSADEGREIYHETTLYREERMRALHSMSKYIAERTRGLRPSGALYEYKYSTNLHPIERAN